MLKNKIKYIACFFPLGGGLRTGWFWVVFLFVCKQVELCIKILSDILELLFQENVGPTKSDVTEIMLAVLRTVIQSHINMDRESPYAVKKTGFFVKQTVLNKSLVYRAI